MSKKDEIKNEIIETKKVFYQKNLTNLVKQRGFFGNLAMRIEHGLIPSRRKQFEYSVNEQIRFLTNEGNINKDDALIKDAITMRDRILMKNSEK